MFIATNRVEIGQDGGGRDRISAIVVNTDHIMAALPHTHNDRYTILWMMHDDPIVITTPFKLLLDKLVGDERRS